MAKIKNIIFDLGGVLLRLDYLSIPREFAALGFDNFDAIYSQAKQSGLFNDFETGKMSAEEFRNGLRNYNSALTDAEIDRCWNSIILDLPKETFNYLKELRKDYRLFLLSNTNEIHVKKFSQVIEDTFGYENYSSLFEKIYYSNEIGLRKPNTECYEYVIRKNRLLKEETLFIDDTEKNIAGAKETRIRTFLYPQNKNLKESLANVLAQFN